MRKVYWFVLIALALLLAGCLSSENKPTPTSSPIPTTVLEIPSAAGATSAEAGCTVVTVQPTPGPTPVSPYYPISAQDWSLGPSNAPITIINYGDFQCPYCSQLAPVMARLVADFPTQLRYVYRHLPQPGTTDAPLHDKSTLATQAAEAAGLQQRFWEMHDLLYARQSEWSGLSVADFQTWLIERAGELGLDAAQFTTDLTSRRLALFAQTQIETAGSLGISSTPFIVFNGNVWPGNVPMDYWSMWAVIQLTLLEERQFTQCPPMTIDPTAQYIATLETEQGNIVLELLPDVAPLAVNSFIFLAENGWFDGVTFHRVIPGFMAQTGDPSGTGFGHPGYAFRNEISADYTFDGPGVVAMANSGPDTNGCQFFITYAAAEHLNGGYTIFGHVLSGMEVLESLTPRNPAQNADLPPGDLILKVTIEQR